jgi:hypothetical protein
MDAVDPIDKKPPKLTKQVFVARGSAAMTLAGELGLAIHLRFHDHASRSGSPSGWRFTSRQQMDSGQPARRGERKSSGVGAGRAWWLWEWLE